MSLIRLTLLLTMLFLTACSKGGLSYAAYNDKERSPLGEGSYSMRQPTLREPISTLSTQQKLDFYTGHSFSKNPWISAPASTTARDGLGPLFSARSCIACHVNGGRGTVSKPKDDMASLVVKLSIPSDGNLNISEERLRTYLTQLGVVPEPNYGDQLQIKGLAPFNVQKEATHQINWQYSQGQYDDGETYELRYPNLTLIDLGYGELSENTSFSMRIAPSLGGMGFIDAIPESDILARVDVEDADNNGISGRENRVWDISNETTVLGRFGWKASQPNVKQQTASALRNDMGITSSLFPDESCTEIQLNCFQAPNGNGTGNSADGANSAKQTEVEEKLLDAIVLFSASVAIPNRKNAESEQILKGREVFYQTGCQACHQPSYITDSGYKDPTFANQTIWPYSDFLLHDMGDGLADKRTDFLASGNEWRTAPLWGMATIKQINPYASFLHDGRARTIAEAILWHDGEAKQTQQSFKALSKQERVLLVDFVESL